MGNEPKTDAINKALESVLEIAECPRDIFSEIIANINGRKEGYRTGYAAGYNAAVKEIQKGA